MLMATPHVKCPEVIKILSIGNSFSQDCVYYLYDIAQSAGVNVIIGNLYHSGSSLERHDKNAKENLKGVFLSKVDIFRNGRRKKQNNERSAAR